jgi:hypothetical protein
VRASFGLQTSWNFVVRVFITGHILYRGSLPGWPTNIISSLLLPRLILLGTTGSLSSILQMSSPSEKSTFSYASES